jgi:ribonuclease BN (tRNA processing enzyme)
MRILITGVGDAFTARHFGSSALIDAPEGYLLIDCPDPIHRVLREAGETAGWPVDATAVGDIILTHLHGDHCNGLESLGFLRRMLGRQRPGLDRPRLHAAAPVAERLWSRLAPAMDAPRPGGGPSGLEDFYDLHVLCPESSSPVAGLEVRCRRTGHPIPTFGLLIGDGTTTLGWSADTPFEQGHIDWLDQADLIVHESNRGAAHTPIERLNTLPDRIRAKMRLIHLPDDFDAACTDIEALREGEVVEVKRD